MAEEKAKNDHEEEKAIPRAKMAESPNSEPVGAPANSKSENSNPNPSDYTAKKTNYAEATGNGGNKGRSCKGCLYYSSQMKSNSRNPLCVGLSRSIPNAPRYIVGKSEMEASKEGKTLRDFRYGCIGYSLYPDQKNQTQTSDAQETEPELPVCIGLEVLVDRKMKESLSDGNRLPQHRSPQPTSANREDFLSRFTRNANLIANGVAKNARRVGNQIKQSLDFYPHRRRPNHVEFLTAQKIVNVKIVTKFAIVQAEKSDICARFQLNSIFGAGPFSVLINYQLPFFRWKQFSRKFLDRRSAVWIAAMTAYAAACRRVLNLGPGSVGIRPISELAKSNGKRVYLVDTLALVRKLEGQGVESKQAQAITEAMMEVLNDSMENVSGSYVSKSEMQKSEMLQDNNLSMFKTEVKSSQDHHFSMLQHEMEKVKNDIEKMRSELRYEIDKVTAGQRLDLNLERGRIRDELNNQNQETTNLTTKLDREIHTLRAQLEAAKYDVIKYCIGTLASVSAVGLAVIRILM
ncbi:coiled-coil 90B-like protein [Perilla frutescens var. frutescens]|nr:coiled-coil 90B-like protein [Perilla frutescens var. frutescens]